MALSYEQNKFLAMRHTTKTDQAACELAEISDESLRRWKNGDPEFKAEYDNLGRDGVELAKRIARQHLGQAMLTLIEATAAKHSTKHGSEAQWDARIAAARSILAVHKISTTSSSVAGDAENPITLTINADELFKAVKERTKKEKPTVPQ